MWSVCKWSSRISLWCKMFFFSCTRRFKTYSKIEVEAAYRKVFLTNANQSSLRSIPPSFFRSFLFSHLLCFLRCACAYFQQPNTRTHRQFIESLELENVEMRSFFFVWLDVRKRNIFSLFPTNSRIRLNGGRKEIVPFTPAGIVRDYNRNGGGDQRRKTCFLRETFEQIKNYMADRCFFSCIRS